MSIGEYEVQNEGIKKALLYLSNFIKGIIPEGWGFTLLLFSFGPGGHLFYSSNANREDMIKAMKEFIAKEEKEN